MRGTRRIRRILVAVKEPARGSLAALVKGAQLARAAGASLELFHALSTPINAEAFLYTRRNLVDIERKIRERTLGDLEKTARRLRAKGMKVTTAAEWDFPAYEAVVRRAIRTKADLIVAERHVGRRLAPWLLHLNDWELLRLSPVPVLLAKSAGPYRRPAVLAALDPTHAFAKSARLDPEILRVAADVAAALGGRVHAMHAYLPVPSVGLAGEVMSGGVLGQLQAEALAMARRGFERELKKSGIPSARRHLVRRIAVDAIPAVAREIRAGIVAMGAVSRSGLRRVFIGNTAERVLDELPCDILVVKPPRFKTPVARARRGVRLVTTPPPMPTF
jgi:universal stress protein E